MPDNWNLPPLSALGFTPFQRQPPPPQPEIPPEMLLELLGNRPPPSSPLGFGSLQRLLGSAGGQPELQNPLPAGPPPVAGSPPPAPLSLGGVGFNEVLNPAVRGALMPQGRAEQEELDRSNRTAGAVGDVAGIAAPFAIPGGAIMRGAGLAARTAGNLLARAPRITAAVAAGGATALGTGQAEPPNELETVRTNEQAARAAHAAALKRQTELEADIERYNPARILRLSGEDRTRAVRELQEELRRLTDDQGRPLYTRRTDGDWGGQTTEAAAARRRQLQNELETARTAVRTANDNLKGLGTRREALERQTARDVAEANQPWLDRMVHRYSGPLGFATGLVGGNLFTLPARWAATRGVNAANQSRVAAANALLDRPSRDIPGRFGGVNEFYRRGGEGAPFRPAPTAAGGFTEVRPPPDAGALYPPRAPLGRPGLAEYVHPADAAVLGSMGLGLGYGEISLERARRERDAARSENDGSRQAQERLALAESQYDWANMRANIMRGAPLAYPLSAIPFRYKNPRPNVERGEAEVMRLSRWRRRQD